MRSWISGSESAICDLSKVLNGTFSLMSVSLFLVSERNKKT